MPTSTSHTSAHDDKPYTPFVRRPLVIGSSIFLALFFISLLLAFYEFRYQHKALPRTTLAGMHIGGLTQEEITNLLQIRYDQFIESGLTISLNETTKTLPLQTSLDPDFTFDLISFDPRLAAQNAVSYGHRGPWHQRLTESLSALFHQRIIYISELPHVVTVNTWALEETVNEAFEDHTNPGRPTDFIFPESGRVQVAYGSQGTQLDLVTFFHDFIQNIDSLSSNSVDLRIIASDIPLSVEDALTVAPDALALLEKSPITLTYTTDTQRTYSWDLTRAILSDILIPRKNETGLVLGVDGSTLNALFEEITHTINVEPVDARFRIENGRVVEFAGSQNGIIFDADRTQLNLEELLNNPATENNATLTITASTKEPETSTGDVNDLGITEILGIGWSGWRGSPPNRIKNIRHATQKLNGLLIAPGEQISLTSKLGPLTLEDGYLPEMVIAGDEIKPEIAGGLCQIGTTAFRAAMNAGLKIDERRNHSLVVSYYNDPSNGNPGTDATLYEPVLDLKFTNTTGYHILLTTEFNEPGQELIYTFWGTSDGRKAYYTPPQVLSRTAPGPTVYKETTTLPPGVQKCQHAYAGASTTFDYIIEHPDGTHEVQTFDSHYRALPEICLVGIDPNAPEEGDTSETETIITPSTDIPLENKSSIISE